jgi:hypothetical protein
MPAQLASTLRVAAGQYAQRTRTRGWLCFGASTVLILVLGTLVLSAVADSSDGVRNAIIFFVVLLEAAAAWYWLIYRLRQPVSLTQLALYIDQMHPELQNRIVSAVEFSGLERKTPSSQTDGDARSAWMIEKFLEDTDLVARSTPIGDLVNEDVLLWTRRAAVALCAIGAGIILFYHAQWMPNLKFLSSNSLSDSSHQVSFTVSPGNAEIRRGDNAIVLVKTSATGRDVALAWQPKGSEEQTSVMSANTDGNVWHYDFRSVQDDFQYRVQVGNLQSETFTITTWSPPKTEAINLTYTYPDYLNRPEEHAPNSGPITAIVGTRVAIDVDVNKKLKEAALVFDDGTRMPLTEASGARWTGELVVATNGRYQVDVIDLDGRSAEYQPHYEIKALPDDPPKVRISFPRGDDEATSLEEIPFAVEVSDDFGIESWGIQYEVAGREPVRVPLSGTSPVEGAPLLKESSEHLLTLEDLELSPGDLVTWTVWARDFRPDRDEYAELGDPFFLEIRPYRRTFAEAMSNAGAGAGEGQGQGQEPGATSQKDVLIATWNLRRSSAALTDVEFGEKRAAIVTAQKQLIEEVQAAQGGSQVLDLLGPGAGDDSAKEALAERLVDVQHSAVEALERAAMPDPGRILSEAMEYEQEAYSLLKKLEGEERTVQMAMNRGAGQGRGASQREIDQLEMDRNRNFYEEEQTPQRPSEQQAREEALNALNELTLRQQMANEEMARLISELELAKTEEEKEEIRRRLARLEEELANNLESLDEISSQVASGEMDRQQAADARESLNRAREDMNRSLESLQEQRLQQARAAGGRAAETLDEVQRDLSGLSRTAAAEGLRDLVQQMDELGSRQEDVQTTLDELRNGEDSSSLDGLNEREERKRELAAEHEAMAGAMERLMEEASQLADGTRESQELLSRKLNDWLRDTSQRSIAENMRQVAPLVDYGIWEPLSEMEGRISDDLRAAGEALRDVENYHVEDELGALRMALREIEGVLDGPGENEDAIGSGTEGLEEDEAASGGSTSEDESQQEAQTPGGESENQSQGSARGPGGEQPGDEQPGDDPQVPNQGREGSGGRPGDGGPRIAGGGGFAPDYVDEFMGGDYGRWIDAIRNAEALLPRERNETGEADDSIRRQLERVRESIGDMRREYRAQRVSPQFEGFLDRVVNPLVETAAEIDREIRDRMQVDEFALTKEGEVPIQYQKQVAEYFRSLSEAAASRD